MTTQRCAGAHDRYGIHRTNPRKNLKRMNLVGKEGCVCACVRVCVRMRARVQKLFLIIGQQIDGGRDI
jgi:hypothetical protein